MLFHFCPHCGTKLQPNFRFCPSCGEKLPCPENESGSVPLPPSSPPSSLQRDKCGPSAVETPASSHKSIECQVRTCSTSAPVTPRPPPVKARKSLRLERYLMSMKDSAPPVGPSASANIDGSREENGDGLTRTPIKQNTITFKQDAAVEPTVESSSSSPVRKSPRPVRGKARVSSPAPKHLDEGKMLADRMNRKAEEPPDDQPAVTSAPVSPPVSTPPFRGKSRAKRARHASAVQPLPEGVEVTDNTSKKWKLVRLSSQSATELVYEVSSKGQNHILKLGAKDGKLFNEQNFLQRAAKPVSVDKWIKQNKMDFLGIPTCVGFGLHTDSYRFLIFPNMGQSLQSLMKDHELLSEKVVLHLACRILDVLQYIHANEYVHADINAESVYIKQGDKSQVYLAGYCHAFRYCPGGQHVEYREDSRTPHEGTVELISLDAHKGAAPSRRGDLQSLGYCMLLWHTGRLPWSALSHPDQVAAEKQRYRRDVPALLSHCFRGERVSSAYEAYLSTAMMLQYSEEPDYSALKAGLSTSLVQLGGSLEQPLGF